MMWFMFHILPGFFVPKKSCLSFLELRKDLNIPIFGQIISLSYGGGWVRRCCHASWVTGASNRYWLTVGQGLLSLQQVRVERECFVSSVSSLSFIFLFLPYPPLSSPLLSLLSLFSLSLGDDTKWPTRADVSLNTNTIKILIILVLKKMNKSILLPADVPKLLLD